MKNLETRINQFYDLFDEEILELDYIRNSFDTTFIEKGFLKMETSGVEEKARYLSTTKVHYSKIFEMHRSKEKSTFLLQSDLALSMSRCIADNCGSNHVLKLIQTGDIFRDRVDKIPGYRRKFKQILVGCWGSKNFFYDIELISSTINTLIKLYPKESFYFQISNQMILNCYFENCAEIVRFNGMNSIKGKISAEEFEALYKLFSKSRYTLKELENLVKNSTGYKHFSELKRVYDLCVQLSDECFIPMFFSIENLDGTNHYSGMTYRIYADTGKQNVLIVDGGRIDSMVEKFNHSKKVPAVCLGIGIQILCQILSLEKSRKKTVIFCDENSLEQIQYAKKIQTTIKNDAISIVLSREKNFSKYYKSPFYQNTKFVILNYGEKIILKNFSSDDMETYDKSNLFINKKVYTTNYRNKEECKE